ncbi:MAG TPA: NADPH-dependent 7-cyano-7-deazaguanine reductase QueF, partial [Ruminococcaceae bacterium]|nr:NADPH-dependent 7-cyano-7-deazaguanine reductase QueF [Oscillospiraceae bacterium]
MEKTRENENLTLLGNKNTRYSFDYTPDVLETFENKHKENDYFV